MERTERARDLFLKGLEHLEKREFRKAEKVLSRSLTLAPTSPSILNNLAISQLEQKKFHDAAFSARRLLEFDPGNIDACFMLATCEKELKNFDKAVEIYDTIVAIDPSLMHLLAGLQHRRECVGQFGFHYCF